MKKFIIILVLLSGLQLQAENMAEVLDILKWVESSNNPELVGDGGRSWGILQIQQVVIDDVNKKYGTQYVHSDAFDEACAEEIFHLYTTMWVVKLEKRHNRRATLEDMLRIWNGGPRGYQKSATDDYIIKYYKYKKLFTMNKRKCFVKGKLGLVTATYTHTVDVLLFKTKKQ